MMHVRTMLDTVVISSDTTAYLARCGREALALGTRVCRVALRSLALLAACCCGSSLLPLVTLGFVAAWLAPREVERALGSFLKLFYIQSLRDLPISMLWTCLCFIAAPATLAVAAFASGVALKILFSPFLPGCSAVDYVPWLNYFFS